MKKETTMTKREFGNMIHEARINKGLLLREMNLGAMRHSHIECGDFEVILYRERKELCEQLSLDRKEIDETCKGFDGLFFLVFPGGDRSKITVIDLMHCVSYERNDWENVNDNTYYNRDEAIKSARDIADRYGLEYMPFESRYDNGDEKDFLY
jgi:hypothetical protein